MHTITFSEGIVDPHPRRTYKIRQSSELSWQQAKTKLEEMSNVGILTLLKIDTHRLIISWESRLFPNMAVKEGALSLPVYLTELTVIFKNQSEQRLFRAWLQGREILS